MYQYRVDEELAIVRYLESLEMSVPDQVRRVATGVLAVSCADPLPRGKTFSIVLLCDIARLSGPTERGDPPETLAVIYVARTADHAKELLSYNRCNSLALMDAGALLIHLSGVLAALHSRFRCELHYLLRGDSYLKDRDAIHKVCGLRAAASCSGVPNGAASAPGGIAEQDHPGNPLNCQSVGDSKSIALFNMRMEEPLDIFGTDYIYAVYRHQLVTGEPVSQTLYIIKESTAITVVHLDGSDYGKVGTD